MRRASTVALGRALSCAMALAGAGCRSSDAAPRRGESAAPPPISPELKQALASIPDMPLSNDRTDVVVVIGCTVRRDRLGVYGNHPAVTPFLDRLARHGVVFDRVVAQAPWTRPSMGALATGRWPRVLGLDDAGDERITNNGIAEEFVTLAETLHGAGYATLGAVANPNVNRVFGFAQGYDSYFEPDKLWRDEFTKLPGNRVVDAFLEAVDRVPPERRIYGKLVLVDTHGPRSPTEAERRRVDPSGHRYRRHTVRDYDAALGRLDGVVARLFASLKRRRPNLLFVFIADHGEGLHMPKHHGRGHGRNMYRTSTEVPWIVHHPGLPRPGRRVGGLAMGMDLHPTLLGLLGITPEGALDGRDQSQAVLGKAGSARGELAFSETFFADAHKAAVFDRDWHLVQDHVSGAPPELYAAADALERDDVATQHPQVASRLAAQLAGWEQRVEAARATAAPPMRAEPSQRTLRRLHALGYATTPGTGTADEATAR